MRKLVGGTTVLAGFALLAIAATALATSSVGVTSTPIAQGNAGDIDVRVKTGEWKVKLDTKGPSTLAVSENRVAPGGDFGWHSHPGPSLVIVKSGTSTFYRGDDPDCTPEVHPAGTAYVDPGGVVHIARNEGSQELVVLVTRLTPAGAPPRNDEPDPGNCDF
ncbi:MAG: cupin domain-containing protein [Actinobacteria bacterium]|nr:cupin domain-containing protein [Actinomycetota bacterium]